MFILHVSRIRAERKATIVVEELPVEDDGSQLVDNFDSNEAQDENE